MSGDHRYPDAQRKGLPLGVAMCDPRPARVADDDRACVCRAAHVAKDDGAVDHGLRHRPERVGAAVRGDRAARPGAGVAMTLLARVAQGRIVPVAVHEHDPADIPVRTRRSRSCVRRVSGTR